MKKALLTIFVLTLGIYLMGQQAANSRQIIGSEKQGLTAGLNENGTIGTLKIRYASGWQEVKFRSDEYGGPGFGNKVVLTRKSPGEPVFIGENNGIAYRLAYAVRDGKLLIEATVANNSGQEFAPEQLPLVLGIDHFMDKFPEWNTIYFPTFLRCEPSHLWGYFMTPMGRILGIYSNEPVGSYTVGYRNIMWDHYIYTTSLDLLQQPPVPDHHPVYRPLAAGEKRSWTIGLMAIESIDQITSKLSVAAQAPMLDLYSYTLEPGQAAEIKIISPSPVTGTLTTPYGKQLSVEMTGDSHSDKYLSIFKHTDEYGYYDLKIESLNGKTATGRFYVRPTWSWYIKSARQEALRLVPRADLNGGADGYSCENYYGLLGFWLAAKYFPDPAIDLKGARIQEKVLERLFREKAGKYFSVNAERIQNGSFMVSVLVDNYQATGDPEALRKAGEFAEFILSRQHADGYYGGYGMHPYTSVLYVAKAIVELMEVEAELGKTDPVWIERYNRHYQSVKRSIDDLVRRKLDVKTEGGGTFEDGSVSCTAAQIALFALMQEDPAERKKYTDVALEILDAHSCLTRLLSPDTRSNGSTIRWWEAWADNKTEGQMTTSPHGWSGWRLYAVYYAYLLTGEEKYLRDLMNALGSCSQLMDWPSGRLRQAYVTDPHIVAWKHLPDPKQPEGLRVPKIYSEEYLETIGEWYGKNTAGDTYLDKVEWGWNGDQIPYEIFKAMEEIALTSAYIIERADGTLKSYNCSCLKNGSILIVKPSESIVKQVHLNLKTPAECQVVFADGRTISDRVSGMEWIRNK